MLRLMLAALSAVAASSKWEACPDKVLSIAQKDGFAASPGGPERKIVVGRKPDGLVEGDDVCIELNNEGENVDVQIYDRSLTVAAIEFGIRDKLGTTRSQMISILEDFYARANPDKVAMAGSIAHRYKGFEEELFKRLERQYPEHKVSRPEEVPVICFFLPDGTLLGGEKSLEDYGLEPGDNMYAVLGKDVAVPPWFKRGEPDKTCAWVAEFRVRCEVVGNDGRRAFEACDACGGSVAPTPEGYTRDATETEDSVNVEDYCYSYYYEDLLVLEDSAWVAKYWNGAARRGGDPDPYKDESIFFFEKGRIYSLHPTRSSSILKTLVYKDWHQTLDKLPTTITTGDESLTYSMDGNGDLVIEFGYEHPATIVYEKKALADVDFSQYDETDDDDDRAGSKSVGCLIVLMCLIALASFFGGLFVGKRCARKPPRAAVVVSLPTKLDKQVSA